MENGGLSSFCEAEGRSLVLELSAEASTELYHRTGEPGAFLPACPAFWFPDTFSLDFAVIDELLREVHIQKKKVVLYQENSKNELNSEVYTLYWKSLTSLPVSYQVQCDTSLPASH